MDTPTTTTHHKDCRFISGSGWCCAPQCGRPVINVRKGDVREAFPVMDAIYRAPGQSTTISTYAVEIVCQSPTGDQSTSWTFHLPCSTAGQAESVAAMWRKRSPGLKRPSPGDHSTRSSGTHAATARVRRRTLS